MSRFNFSFLSLSLALSLLVGCGKSLSVHSPEKKPIDSEAPQVKDKATLKVLVSYFKPESMHDDFMDGTSKSYDLMVLKVVEPARYKGLELQIANESNSDVKPAQMGIGKGYVVEVDESLVDEAAKVGRSENGTSSSELYISPSQVRIVSEWSD